MGNVVSACSDVDIKSHGTISYNTTDRYEITKRLGQGGYGKVYLGVDKKLGKAVAIKFISRKHQDSALYEASYTRRCAHDNIVELLGVTQTKKHIILVYELLKESLDQVRMQFNPSDVRGIMWQILLAVDACHKRGISHLDIKPANILRGFDNTIKLADFGISSSVYYKLPTNAFTVDYRPPELLLGSSEYDACRADMWALGMVFAFLLLNEHLLSLEPGSTSDHKRAALKQICSIFGKPDESTWPGVSSLPRYGRLSELKVDVHGVGLWETLQSRGCRPGQNAFNLLTKMLVMDPSKRITAAKALESKYFMCLM